MDGGHSQTCQGLLDNHKFSKSPFQSSQGRTGCPRTHLGERAGVESRCPNLQWLPLNLDLCQGRLSHSVPAYALASGGLGLRGCIGGMHALPLLSETSAPKPWFPEGQRIHTKEYSVLSKTNNKQTNTSEYEPPFQMRGHYSLLDKSSFGDLRSSTDHWSAATIPSPGACVVWIDWSLHLKWRAGLGYH